MIVFGQKCCIRQKSGLTRSNLVVLWAKWLYSGKSGCIGECGISRSNKVVFLESRCVWATVIVFLQNGCIWANWLYSGKLVVFGQNGCIRAKW